MFRASDDDTDIFDNVAGVLQRDTLAVFQFMIRLGYVGMKENGLTFKKKRQVANRRRL